MVITYIIAYEARLIFAAVPHYYNHNILNYHLALKSEFFDLYDIYWYLNCFSEKTLEVTDRLLGVPIRPHTFDWGYFLGHRNSLISKLSRICPPLNKFLQINFSPNFE